MSVARKSALLALFAWIIVAVPSLSASDASDDLLAHAKTLYASAAYEDALSELDRVQAAAPDEDAIAVLEYRAFCLLALERTDEARTYIERIYHANPHFFPAADQASPRIQAVFREVRRQALPKIVMERYAAAKSAFDRRDPDAKQQFDQVLALLDDPDLGEGSALEDLRGVVSAFRDLDTARAAAPQPVPAEPIAVATSVPIAPGAAPIAATPPAATPSGPAPSAPPPNPSTPTASAQSAPPPAVQAPPAKAPEVVYSADDASVMPPEPRSQNLPEWHPSPEDATHNATGVLRLLIDQTGTVTSATMVVGTVPAYDRLLLRAARDWRFRPALKGGKAVSYIKVMEIRLIPTR